MCDSFIVANFNLFVKNFLVKKNRKNTDYPIHLKYSGVPFEDSPSYPNKTWHNFAFCYPASEN